MLAPALWSVLLSASLWGASAAAATDAGAGLGWLADSYSTSTQAPAAGAASPDEPFWLSFDQPDLTAAVVRGLSANPDLGALDALAGQQRALAAQSLSAVLPSLSFDVQGQVSPFSSLAFGFGLDGLPSSGPAPVVYGLGSAKLNASLVVDLWGRSLSTWRSGRLGAAAATGDRDAAALGLAAAIASAWLDVSAVHQQLEILGEQLTAAQDLLEIVRLRYEGGAASALDVLQQEQTVAALDAQLPLIQAASRTTAQVLAVAQGMDPTGPLPAASDALPALPPRPSLGSPVDLLDARPDVRAALDRVDAAGASRSAALRGLLPTLALTGSAGWETSWIDTWTTQDTWTAGGSLSVPLFSGGATHAAIRAGSAAREAAQRQLESTLRGAVQEVEIAAFSETQQALRVDASARQLDRAQAAWSLALDQYAAGLADYTQVQGGLNALLSARLSHLQAQRDLLGARLSLHQALGGSWTHDLTSLGAQ